MRTFYIIMRSIFTSLLFLILFIAFALNYIFLLIRFQDTKISDLIDREYILKEYVKDDTILNNKELHDFVINYIDNYINYVFYKRSYPSLNYKKLNNLDESMIENTQKKLDKLKEDIDLKYETVLRIREINNFLYNGSVFLLINIGIFILFLITSIYKQSFKEALKLFGLAMITSAIFILIVSGFAYSKISSNPTGKYYVVLNNLINSYSLKTFFNIAIVYIIIGLSLNVIFYILKHRK